jgi:SAM-dependent methyltransferase
METAFERAQVYVGNTGENFFIVGRLQLDLLKMNGCTPASQVLEIGCGCLVAGRPIIEYLNAGGYVGIEPNTWLLDAVQAELPGTVDLVQTKRPLFLENTDFDASGTGRKFDFVISHSILSHAAAWQLPLFLIAVKRVLTPNGIGIASIRFSNENNELMGDSDDKDWVYPGVSYFSWEMVQRVAAGCGLAVEWRKDYRDYFTKEAPSNYHDWIRLTHAKEREERRSIEQYLHEVEAARDWHANESAKKDQIIAAQQVEMAEMRQILSQASQNSHVTLRLMAEAGRMLLSLTETLAARTHDLVDTQHRIHTLEAGLARQQLELDRQKTDANSANHRVRALENSWSWKLTKPLRILGRR